MDKKVHNDKHDNFIVVEFPFDIQLTCVKHVFLVVKQRAAFDCLKQFSKVATTSRIMRLTKQACGTETERVVVIDCNCGPF